MRRGLCSIDKDRFVPNYTTSASQPPLTARSVNIHGFCRVYVGGMVTSTLCRPILVRPTAATLRLVLVPCLFCLKFGIKYVSKFILGPSILSNLTFTPQIYYLHVTFGLSGKYLKNMHPWIKGALKRDKKKREIIELQTKV